MASDYNSGVTAVTSATAIVAFVHTGVQSWVIKNEGAASLRVGTSAITTTTGYLVPAGGTLSDSQNDHYEDALPVPYILSVGAGGDVSYLVRER